MADPPVPNDVRVSLWRAAAGFRLAALIYLVVVFVRLHERYARPGLGIAVLVVAAVITAALVVLVLRGLASMPMPARVAVVGADVALTAVLTLATVLVQTPADYGPGTIPTVTTVWAAGPLLEAAIVGGLRWGVAAAIAQFGASVLAHGVGNNDSIDDRTLANGAILVLAGAATGYAARIAIRGQRQLIAAAAAEAEVAERERLARSIHDGALQTLALLQRRLRDPIDDADRDQLATLAGEQEIAMRRLLTRPATGGEPNVHDVVPALQQLGSSTITVSGPAGPIPLPAATVAELAAAVRAALDNVERHAGPDARAWVAIEDTGRDVVITVRDDGVGMPAGRLDVAASEGRLGVASSIRGRLRDLGGTLEVFTAAGAGVELTMRVPKTHEARPTGPAPRSTATDTRARA